MLISLLLLIYIYIYIYITVTDIPLPLLTNPSHVVHDSVDSSPPPHHVSNPSQRPLRPTHLSILTLCIACTLLAISYSLALDLSLAWPERLLLSLRHILEHGHIFNLSLTVSPKIYRKSFGVSEALFFYHSLLLSRVCLN